MSPRMEREPVANYEQAIWWLIREWVDRYEIIRGEVDMPPEGLLVCDMFWVSEATLRNDLRRAWSQTFPVRAVRARAGWR